MTLGIGRTIGAGTQAISDPARGEDCGMKADGALTATRVPRCWSCGGRLGPGAGRTQITTGERDWRTRLGAEAGPDTEPRRSRLARCEATGQVAGGTRPDSERKRHPEAGERALDRDADAALTLIGLPVDS